MDTFSGGVSAISSGISSRFTTVNITFDRFSLLERLTCVIHVSSVWTGMTSVGIPGLTSPSIISVMESLSAMVKDHCVFALSPSISESVSSMLCDP